MRAEQIHIMLVWLFLGNLNNRVVFCSYEIVGKGMFGYSKYPLNFFIYLEGLSAVENKGIFHRTFLELSYFILISLKL